MKSVVVEHRQEDSVLYSRVCVEQLLRHGGNLVSVNIGDTACAEADLEEGAYITLTVINKTDGLHGDQEPERSTYLDHSSETDERQMCGRARRSQRPLRRERGE